MSKTEEAFKRFLQSKDPEYSGDSIRSWRIDDLAVLVSDFADQQHKELREGIDKALDAENSEEIHRILGKL